MGIWSMVTGFGWAQGSREAAGAGRRREGGDLVGRE